MIKDIVDKWLKDAKKDLIANYNKMGLRASGNWAKELETYSSVGNNVPKLGIKGVKYTEQLVYGRGRNHDNSPESIRKWVGWAGSTILKDWCKQKGIDSSISYAIAYKIAREGTKVPNKFNSGKLVSDVITKERTDKLMDALKEEFKSDIKSKMIEQLKK